MGSDGNVYEGRGWYVKPEKSIIEPELDQTINIAFIGKHSSKLKKWIKGKAETDMILSVLIHIVQILYNVY